MADKNTSYVGSNVSVDIDTIMENLINAFPHSESIKNQIRNSQVTKEIKAQYYERNNEARATIDGVRVPYAGTTKEQRLQWLKDRIQAVDKRVVFIQTEAQKMVENLRSIGSSAGDAAFSIIGAVASSVPVVGTVFSFLSSYKTSNERRTAQQITENLQEYAADVQTLASLRGDFVKEMTALNSVSTEPTNEAPKVPVWYWYVGIAAVILLLIIVRNRRNNR